MGLQHSNQIIHRGFSLVELIVVILILSVIAGATIMAYGPDFVDDKRVTATEYEMTQIRDAILKFKRDNPSHSLIGDNLCSPADASFLFNQEFDDDNDCEFGENTGTPDPDQFADWDPDYRIGWQGPYISSGGNPTSDIGGAIQHSGLVTSGTDYTDVPVLTDAYDNPYLFFDLDDTNEARIVSMGENGAYNSVADTCNDALTNSSGNDDLVLCLR